MQTIILTTVCIVFVVIVALRYLYNFYKSIGRRCPRCGEWRRKKNRRRYEIILANDEIISIKSPNGKLRWWIRRVTKLTFSTCESCNHIRLVKIDNSPVSIWHAWWIKFSDKKQYMSSHELAFAYDRDIRQMRTFGNLEKKYASMDTPPLPPFDESHPVREVP